MTIRDKIRKFNEKIWHKVLRIRLKNDNFTLLTNNCIGGVIYHNLGMKFQSPTINLFFKPEGYINFIMNLQYYVSCEMIQVKDATRDYPVGKLIPKDKNHEEIVIYFQHYKSFDDAKEKWLDRCSRINYEKVYCIYEFYDTLYDIDTLEKFDKIDRPKIAITHRFIEGIENQKVVNCYQNDQPIGNILKYSGYIGKRYLDKFDYVSFLNKM